MGLFKFFNNHKAENITPKVEAVETPITKPETISEIKKDQAETEPQNFTERLDDLKEAMGKMEAQGLKLDEKVLENIMQMNVGDFMEYINGGENIKEKDVKNLHENISQILNGELNDTYKGNKFKEFLRKPASKVAFVTLLLFLKFAPHSQAHEAPVKDGGDAKHKTEKTYEGGDDTEKAAYHLDTPPSMENMAVMDLTNSYETDQALISEADANEIKADFKAFLDQVNSKNIDKVLQLDFKIYGSSDERPTSTWKGGNLELTEARIAAAEKIMKSELESHDFSNSDLSQEEIKKLQGKEFKHGVPEDGVTHITDLTNPDTGKNYTDKEVNEMKKTNLTKYHDLLRECRYIKINLMAQANEEIQPIPTKTTTIEISTSTNMVKKDLTLISEYDQTIILVDNSPSMLDSKNYMGGQLQTVDKEANIKVATFSDKLNNMSATDNFKQAGEIIKGMPTGGSAHERSIFVADQAIENFDMSGDKMMESKLLIINTDEAVQTTKAELEKLLINSQTKGIKVYFNLGYDDNQQVLKVSLEEVSKNFNDLYQKKLDKINKDIETSKKQIENKELRSEFRKIAKERLEKLEKQLEDLENTEFKVKNFVTPNGQTITMET